jgi:LacI family transcriptional regulator
MKDVASKAGVALKTVSRVVNGEPGVTPETAKRVLGAISDLGFRRNESARLLRTGRTATLGFITDTWTSPDQAAVYRGIEHVAREHGYLLYAGSTDTDTEREERLALAMCARRVDGLVIIPTPGSHDYLVAEMEAGVQCVFVMRPPKLVSADVVLPDEAAGARAAIGHLLGQGHHRIGFLGGPSGHRSSTLRAGCEEALSSLDRTANATLADLTTERDGSLSAPTLAAADVSAVFCADQSLTMQALHAVRATGAPMAIVGFGDFNLSGLVSPPVTVVSYDPVLIGRTAGELLIRRLTGDRRPPRRVEVPVRLIVR